MPITIREIAQEANVSTATVSMVMNNKPGISSPTRMKVLKIVEAHGYNVSPLKKEITRNSGIIQLTIHRKHSQVVSDTAFFEALIAGIESTASLSGYQLTIKSVLSQKLYADSICGGLNDDSIDGVLLLGTEMDSDDMIEAAKLNKPLLILDACFMGINANCVVIDNISGVYSAVQHLIENGHRKIGYLKSSIAIQNFLERYEGYLKVMSDSGLKCKHSYTIPLHPTMEGSFSDMMTYLSGNPELPTAFVSDNDIIAFGAMRAMKEAGLRIPQDISIVGFDDMPFCTISGPSLSTINVNKENLGKLAVENLTRIIDGENSYTTKTVLGVELVSRDSVLRLN